MQFCSFTILIMFTNLSVNAQIFETRYGEIIFEKYPRYQNIQDYLEYINSTYSEFVEVKEFGRSVENRTISYIKISTGGHDKRPILFVDAGIHAREWLAPLEACYIIYQLLENKPNRPLMQKVDWVIVPLVNPDGYEFSHKVDKLWRKNRAKGRICPGVDLNRNFNFQWSQPGASDSECSSMYAGRRPFSEPESLALSELLEEYSHRIRMYLSIHSYAQSILYPWGYTTDLPFNTEQLHKLATHSAVAVYKINSTEYKIGSAANVLYVGSGTSRDWVYGVLNISFAYTIELKGTDSPIIKERFQVPVEYVVGIVSEMFEGIKVLWSFVDHHFGKK